MYRKYVAAFVVSVSLAGCAGNIVSPSDPYTGINLDKVQIASSQLGDTLVVSSSVSWSSYLEPEGAEALDWIEITEGEGLNLDGCIREYPLILSTSANLTFYARKAKLVLTNGRQKISIPVEQGRCVPELSIDKAVTLRTAAYDTTAHKITIKANLPWKASVEGGFKDCSLSITQGSALDVATNLLFSPKSTFDNLEAVVTVAFQDEVIQMFPELAEVRDTMKIIQKGGAVFSVPFGPDVTAFYDKWSPNLPDVVKTKFSGRFTYNPYGITFGFYSSVGGMVFSNLSSNAFLNFSPNGTEISWVEFCPPEGKTLKSIFLESRNTNAKTYTVYSSVPENGEARSEDKMAEGQMVNPGDGTPWNMTFGKGGVPWTVTPVKGQNVFVLNKQKNSFISEIRVSYAE